MVWVSKNWLEWTVFAISAVILILIFGFLGFKVITTEGDPAIVEVQLGSPQHQGDYYAVPLTIRNGGGQSVEDVQIDVTLIEGGTERETASITIPFLPRESTREGWVAFSSDPAEADEIQPQVVSYVVP